MAKIRRKTSGYRQIDYFMIAAGSMLLLYIYLLVCLYPFLIKPGYAETSSVKYWFLVGLSYGFKAGSVWIPTFFPLCIFCALAGTALDIKSSGKGIKDFIRDLRFSVTDIMVALYALFVIISTIETPYRKDLLWGVTMSYMGFASQFLFILIYFLTSRFFDMKELKGVIYGALLASGLIFVIGILQRFGLDIFNLYDGLKNKLFISTIGQHTFFSSYMIVFYVLGMYLVWISDPGSGMYKAAAIHLAIASCLPCILNADMIFAGMFFALSFLFVMSFESVKRLKAFFEISLIILFSWCVIAVLWHFLDPEFRLEPLPKFILRTPYLWILALCMLLIYIFILKRPEKKAVSDPGKFRYIGRIYAGLVGFAIGVTVVYIILNTKEILPENLRSRANYLLFDPFWGNGRGGIWHDTVMSFLEELKTSPVTAIFGAGPDRYVDVINSYVYDWTPQFSKKIALYAHNEWLNAFINHGVFGGIAYLGIFISALIRYIGKRKEAPAAFGAAVIIIAYLTHQFFGYQQYVSTPYIFLALGIGEQAVREKIKPEVGGI